MGRLTTTYLGIELRSPLVASTGPLTGRPEVAERLQEHGAAAIVLPSLFEEEIVQHDTDLLLALEQGSQHFAEALDYFPDFPTFESSADRYLSVVQETRERLDVPLIASLNAFSAGGWERYAKMLEDAGADAIELNLYRVAADPEKNCADVEAEDVAVIAGVRKAVGIPLAVKLAPYYTALANFAANAVRAGADGLVLMNRFYQPDVDPEAREVVSRLELSHSWELRLPLRWMAILRPQLAGRASLALTTGVSTGVDAVKALMVGADVCMMTSAVLREGPAHFATVERELLDWMDEHDYASATELRGSLSYAATDDPAAYERANYLLMLHAWTTPTRLKPGPPQG